MEFAITARKRADDSYSTDDEGVFMGAAAPFEELSDSLTSFHDLIRTAAKPRYARFQNRLDELRSRLSEGRFHLAVLGQFKRGKSTLLNALLGRAVLPSAVVPLTSLPVFLVFNEEESASVSFESGKRDELPLSALADLVTEEKNPGNEKRVTHVEVGFPAEILASGLTLIDTPGIGSTFRHNTQATVEFLPRSDAALFLVSADPPITETEIAFLENVRARMGRPFFVLNKIDYLSASERIDAEAFLKRTLEKEAGFSGNETTVYMVSAREGLRARETGNTELWESCGMRNLEEALIRFASDEKNDMLFAAVRQKALDVENELALEVAIEERSLSLPLAELEAKTAFFQEKLEQIDKDHERVCDTLAGDHKRLMQFLEERSRIAAVNLRERMRGWVHLLCKEHASEETFIKERRTVLREALENEANAFFEELSQRIETDFKSYDDASRKLLESVRRVAADTFDIPFRSLGVEAALPPPPKFSWETITWTETILTPSPAFLERFLPVSLRLRRRERRWTSELEDLIVRNVETVRFSAIGLSDEVSRKLSHEMTQSFSDLKNDLSETLETTRKERAKRGISCKPEIERLRDIKERLGAIQRRLEEIHFHAYGS